MSKEEQKSIYVQKVVTHKLFNGDFKIQTIALSNSCDYLLIGGQDGLIEVWNYQKMSLDLETIPYQANDLYMLHTKAILSLVFSQDDKLLASGDSEGIIRVWKFSDGKKLREINIQGGEKSGVTTMVFN